MNIKVTEYIDNTNKWTQELTLLRSVFLDLPLEETIKWNAPVYTYKGKNIIGLAGFKNYFGIWFFQGCFLLDQAAVLHNAQEGKTKALRQWRFDDIKAIDLDLIKAYALEAIDNAAKGRELKPQKNTQEIVIPTMLIDEFNKNLTLKTKFYELSQSRQREFSEYITNAKRSVTKERRLEKIIPMIMIGVGLHDKYRNC